MVWSPHLLASTVQVPPTGGGKWERAALVPPRSSLPGTLSLAHLGSKAAASHSLRLGQLEPQSIKVLAGKIALCLMCLSDT